MHPYILKSQIIARKIKFQPNTLWPNLKSQDSIKRYLHCTGHKRKRLIEPLPSANQPFKEDHGNTFQAFQQQQHVSISQRQQHITNVNVCVSGLDYRLKIQLSFSHHRQLIIQFVNYLGPTLSQLAKAFKSGFSKVHFCESFLSSHSATNNSLVVVSHSKHTGLPPWMRCFKSCRHQIAHQRDFRI